MSESNMTFLQEWVAALGDAPDNMDASDTPIYFTSSWSGYPTCGDVRRWAALEQQAARLLALEAVAAAARLRNKRVGGCVGNCARYKWQEGDPEVDDEGFFHTPRRVDDLGEEKCDCGAWAIRQALRALDAAASQPAGETPP